MAYLYILNKYVKLKYSVESKSEYEFKKVMLCIEKRNVFFGPRNYRTYQSIIFANTVEDVQFSGVKKVYLV